MTDQTIPADEIRKIIALYRDGASDRGGMILDALRTLLPAPAPPTLADMTPAKVGDVIESADDPRIAALPIGSILLDRDEEPTTKRWGNWMGDGYTPIPSEGDEFGPWTVLHIPKEEA